MMPFGFDNSKLEGRSPFSFVNTCTTFLNITGKLGPRKQHQKPDPLGSAVAPGCVVAVEPAIKQ